MLVGNEHMALTARSRADTRSCAAQRERYVSSETDIGANR